MNRLRYCVVSALLASSLLNAPLIQAAPKKAAPKKATAKKPPAKPSVKAQAFMGKGVALEGEGDLSFDASLSGRGANLLSSSFKALLKSDGKDISAGLASQRNGFTAVVAILPSQSVSRGDVLIAQNVTLAFSSKVGFYPGQTIPITLPPRWSRTPKPVVALLQYMQTEIKEEAGGAGGSDLRPRESAKRRYSTWVATSGTLKIESVSRTGVTFSVSNAVLAVPKSSASGNMARGILAMKGRGELKLTNIPDGFR